jgi:hypothetical protein
MWESIMRIPARHLLDYDSVAVAVLISGQYPRVTRIGHLKANVPASDWLGHDLRPPREITGEMICSTYVPFTRLPAK